MAATMETEMTHAMLAPITCPAEEFEGEAKTNGGEGGEGGEGEGEGSEGGESMVEGDEGGI